MMEELNQTGQGSGRRAKLWSQAEGLLALVAEVGEFFIAETPGLAACN